MSSSMSNNVLPPHIQDACWTLEAENDTVFYVSWKVAWLIWRYGEGSSFLPTFSCQLQNIKKVTLLSPSGFRVLPGKVGLFSLRLREKCSTMLRVMLYIMKWFSWDTHKIFLSWMALLHRGRYFKKRFPPFLQSYFGKAVLVLRPSKAIVVCFNGAQESMEKVIGCRKQSQTAKNGDSLALIVLTPAPF